MRFLEWEPFNCFEVFSSVFFLFDFGSLTNPFAFFKLGTQFRLPRHNNSTDGNEKGTTMKNKPKRFWPTYWQHQADYESNTSSVAAIP